MRRPEKRYVVNLAGSPSSILVKLKGQRYRALVDTGADISLIHSRVYNQVKKTVRLEASDISLQTVNGEPLRFRGKVTIPLQIGKEKVSHTFLVVDGISRNVLLGRDFCQKNKVRLYYDLQRIRINGAYIPLEDDGHVTSQVYSAKQVTLRPNESVLFRGRIRHGAVTSDNTYQMTAADRGMIADEPGLIVERTLTKIRNRNNVPVLITNTTKKSVTLPRGKVVGRLERLTAEETATIREVKMTKGETKSRSWASDDTEEWVEQEMNVDPHHHDVIKGLILQDVDLFARTDSDLGVTQTVSMKIDTGDHSPIKLKAYRAPLNKREAIDRAVEDMMKAGIIRRSRSPWAFPLVVVEKKDNTKRVCVDYRQLNKVTKQNSYPLPRIDEILDRLGTAKYFSTVDLKSGYFQVPIDEDDRQKTAFTCHRGLYEFNRCPFGLSCAPAIFMELMNIVLEGLEEIAIPYLDDIIILGATEEAHLANLKTVFQRLREHGLKMKLRKCFFFQTEVQYLGFIVCRDGVKPDPDKVSAIRELAAPSNVREVRGLIGMCSYYRRFIPNFSEIAAPLIELTKKHARFRWSGECQTAFDFIKESLTVVPFLAYPDPGKPYTLYTDASDTCIGACLTQEENGEERPIHFLSHRLSKTQAKWSTVEKEAYAIFYALQKMDHYLHGAVFTVKTDHKPLKYLLDSPLKNQKIQRWALTIAGYGGCTIEYIEGNLNAVADLMSRAPKPKGAHQAEGESEVEIDVSDNTFQVSVINSNRLPSENRKSSDPVALLPEDGPSKTLDTASTLDMVLEQGKDAEVAQLRSRLESGEATDAEKANYVMLEQLVYFLSNYGEEPVLRLWVPAHLQGDVLRQFHENCGHFGIDRTYDAIKGKYFWPNLFRDITAYVNTCVPCQSRSGQKARVPIGEMEVPTYPFQKVSIDISGPYPTTLSGNRYILAFVCHYSGWPEAYPLPDKSAQSVAHIFLEKIFPRFGCPQEVVTDNGTENVNAVMKEVFEVLNVHHIKTSIYRPQANSKVERFHATLHQVLSKKLKDSKNTWDLFLNQALAAIRFHKNGSAKFSPFFLLYNRDVVLPIDNLLKPRRKYMGEDHHKIALENQHKYFVMVHQNIKRAQKRRERYANRDAKPVEIQVGDAVLYRNHVKGKLDNNWLPYYKVTKQKTPLTFTIWNQITGESKNVHAEHIRPAPVDEWVVPEAPEPSKGRSMRSRYVETPSSEGELSTDGSESEGEDQYGRALPDWYRQERDDSDEEEDIPLPELAKRLGGKHDLMDAPPADPEETRSRLRRSKRLQVKRLLEAVVSLC